MPELAELSAHCDDLMVGAITRAQLLVEISQSIEHQVVGTGHGATNNPDVFLMPLIAEVDLSFSSYSSEIAQYIKYVELRDQAQAASIGFDVDGYDIYRGTAGDDVVTGVRGDGYKALKLFGGDGNDTLIAAQSVLPDGETDSGDQFLYGHEGNDTYIISKNSGDVRLSNYSEGKGMGTDTVRFADLTLSDLTKVEVLKSDPGSMCDLRPKFPPRFLRIHGFYSSLMRLSFPALSVLANSAGVRLSKDECGL